VEMVVPPRVGGSEKFQKPAKVRWPGEVEVLQEAPEKWRLCPGRALRVSQPNCA
jgi:hypothetical protein